MNLFIKEKTSDIFTELFGDLEQFLNVLEATHGSTWNFKELWTNPKSNALHAIFESTTQEAFVHCGPTVSEGTDPNELLFALHTMGHPVAYVSN